MFKFDALQSGDTDDDDDMKEQLFECTPPASSPLQLSASRPPSPLSVKQMHDNSEVTARQIVDNNVLDNIQFSQTDNDSSTEEKKSDEPSDVITARQIIDNNVLDNIQFSQTDNDSSTEEKKSDEPSDVTMSTEQQPESELLTVFSNHYTDDTKADHEIPDDDNDEDAEEDGEEVEEDDVEDEYDFDVRELAEACRATEHNNDNHENNNSHNRSEETAADSPIDDALSDFIGQTIACVVPTIPRLIASMHAEVETTIAMSTYLCGSVSNPAERQQLQNKMQTKIHADHDALLAAITHAIYTLRYAKTRLDTIKLTPQKMVRDHQQQKRREAARRSSRSTCRQVTQTLLSVGGGVVLCLFWLFCQEDTVVRQVYS